MIDQYIILNRNPKIIIKIFICNISLLTGLTIWGIYNFNFQTYFQIHSQILKLNSYYYSEIIIPAKEVKQIAQQKNLWMGSKKYNYKVVKIDENIINKNNKNYIKMYLEIDNLEQDYKINGYQITIRVKKENKKIIDLLKSKKEE